MRSILFLLAAVLMTVSSRAQVVHHFSLGKQEFLLDGKPFQMISGEMHPARIPREYWRQRIQMAKAMGCNTIAAYVFWNYQETAPGIFDFSSGNRDIAAFIRICQQEGMWVLLRPGPYVCAEWDWGGLPTYLLKIPDIKIRCMDPRYMSAVKRYVARLSAELKGLQCDKGGPIVMVQVENEYGSYANDQTYLKTLRQYWISNGITVPFYTADGPTDFMLEAGNIDGAAIGLDSGSGDGDFEQASKRNPNVPSFSSESYPGWLTHWMEPWQKPDTSGILRDLRYLMEHKKSFNLYVVHGGTNFGFTAGANAFTPVQFQPDVTSYDYDAPISEQGRATPKYYAMRNLIASYTGKALPPVPSPIPAMSVAPFTMRALTSVWKELPVAKHLPQPVPMEMLDQSEGFILYRTKLIGHKSGRLTITEPHDYAMVFLNGQLVDTIYRDGGKWTINLPKTAVKDPVLEILVENMGHINFAQYMIDRKGITDRVTLNGMTLMNWEIFNLPMGTDFIARLSAAAAKPASGTGDAVLQRPGLFFTGEFSLNETADTYLDMSNYKQGVVWVNGHNLGRYWNVGPQFRLYCPASWLKKGINRVIVFDLHLTEGRAIRGLPVLGDKEEAGAAAPGVLRADGPAESLGSDAGAAGGTVAGDAAGGSGEQGLQGYHGGNYAAIQPGDDMAEIVRKAAHVVPSPRQLRWQQLEMTAFLHFGMNTFTDREWGDGKEEEKLFNPTALDAGQWIRTVKAAGIRQVILTCKHHDGFCLWPSKYTEHSVKNSPWRDGKGDVVKEVADACHEQGVGFGVYLSPWDRNSALYGDSVKYNEYFEHQLTELLTQYGRVDEVWFDGANGEGPNGKKQVYDFEAWYKLIRRLQPTAVIAVMGPDVRWVGTESGQGRQTEWSVLPIAGQTQESIAAGSQKDPVFKPVGDMMHDDLGSRARLAGAKGLIWYPAETDVSIRPGWFYHSNEDAQVRTPENLMDIYFSSVGRNGLLLLNIPPDRKGVIHREDAQNLLAWQRKYDSLFGTNLALGAAVGSENGVAPWALLDGFQDTYFTTKGADSTTTIELTLAGKKTFDVLGLQEAITQGQRIERFVFEYFDGGQWKQAAEGTTVGYKRLLRFSPVTAEKVRLRVLSSRLNPMLTELGLFKMPG